MPGPEGDLVVLEAGGARLELALLGATPLHWVVPYQGHPVDLLDGYRDEDELRRQDGVRNGIMAPFCNRVADGRYTFGGIRHDLLPGATDRTIYHGLVRTEPFTVVTLEHGHDYAVAQLECRALIGGAATGYPFDVLVEVTYTLRADALDVEITGQNMGPLPAPFAAGWHPYFRLPGTATVDRLELRVPATVTVVTGADLLPKPGPAAFRPIAGATWEPIGGAVVDAAFGLQRSPASRHRTTVRDPDTGIELVVTQDRGLVHVFTGDTLARDRRASIAVEPVEAMTDAFNRADCADAIRLAPGARRTFAFRVEVSVPTG